MIGSSSSSEKSCQGSNMVGSTQHLKTAHSIGAQRRSFKVGRLAPCRHRWQPLLPVLQDGADFPGLLFVAASEFRVQGLGLGFIVYHNKNHNNNNHSNNRNSNRHTKKKHNNKEHSGIFLFSVLGLRVQEFGLRQLRRQHESYVEHCRWCVVFELGRRQASWSSLKQPVSMFR